MKPYVTAVLVLVFLAGYGGLFHLRQSEQAVVLRSGAPVRVVSGPGMNFRLPILESIFRVNDRIVELDREIAELTTADQKSLTVDALVRYRINDPLRFYQQIGRDGSINHQLTYLLHVVMRKVVGDASLIAVEGDEREQVAARVRDGIDHAAAGYGIEVKEVRLQPAGSDQLPGAASSKTE